jgi:Protein of unknown function (DUF3667)
MSNSSNQHIPNCKNCYHPLAESDKFCPSCGQKKTDGKISMHDLLHELVHMIWHIDGKFFWTLKHLFIPGKLTVEFFKGHHKRYAHPVQLFLVLGVLTFGLVASIANKKKEKKNLDVEEKVFRKQLILELDSVKNTLPAYKDPSVARAIDTLLIKGYGKDERKETFLNLQKELSALKTEGDSLKKTFEKLNEDSVKFRLGNNVEKLDSVVEHLIDMRRELSRLAIKDTQLTKEIIDFTNKMDLADRTLYTSADGWNFRYTTEEDKKKANSNTPQLFDPDSTSIGFFDDNRRVSIIDLYRKTPEELIHEYHVEGFFNKIFFKQIVKMKQQGVEGWIDYIFHKLIWMTALLILPMALIYLLLYRRQKRYYVEHVVFLLHYTAMLFAFAAIIVLAQKIISTSVNGVFLGFSQLYLWFFAMPLAMKRYYQQGWGKTFLKFVIAGFSFIIIGSVVLVLGLAISFAFF